ncbi:MAG: HPF/RaiA family ribosome-associated protein [Sulfurifustaceae bacterium]
MNLPLQVVFRNMPRSDAIEARVRERAEKLDRFAADIMSCRVVVEPPHKHHHKGNLYHVRVDIKARGAELVVARESDADHAHEDVYVAIRDAFDAAKRRLEDYVRRRRGEVKHHEPPSHGRVADLNFAQGYGRIETPAGQLVYFHRNNLIDADFDTLALGTEVQFVEERGEGGPQATTVHVLGMPPTG